MTATVQTTLPAPRVACRAVRPTAGVDGRRGRPVRRPAAVARLPAAQVRGLRDPDDRGRDDEPRLPRHGPEHRRDLRRHRPLRGPDDGVRQLPVGGLDGGPRASACASLIGLAVVVIAVASVDADRGRSSPRRACPTSSSPWPPASSSPAWRCSSSSRRGSGVTPDFQRVDRRQPVEPVAVDAVDRRRTGADLGPAEAEPARPRDLRRRKQPQRRRSCPACRSPGHGCSPTPSAACSPAWPGSPITAVTLRGRTAGVDRRQRHAQQRGRSGARWRRPHRWGRRAPRPRARRVVPDA